MDFVFCPLCGDKLGGRQLGDEGLVPWCTRCDRPFFKAVYPCVIIAVTNSAGEILLIRETDKPRFACVAGYMKPGESVEETVIREVQEEVGLGVGAVRYMGSYPMAERDLIMLGFTCVAGAGDFTLSQEVSEARWLPPREACDTVREGSIAWKLVRAVAGELV